MTLLSEPSAASANDSSAFDGSAEFDFSSLSAPTVIASGEDSDGSLPDSTDRTSDAKICPTCGEPVFKQPGSRGRSPKYHPDCRPSAARRVSDSVFSGAKPRTADKKKQAEADEVIVFVKSKLAMTCTGLMLVDQYVGMVWMMAVPGICENLHGLLVTHDDFRRTMLSAKSGGSWLGLIISLLIPIGATAAHYGFIPQSKIQEIAKNLPIMLYKISQRMKEGNMAMDEMMSRVAEQAAKQNGGGNAPSNSDNAESSFSGQAT